MMRRVYLLLVALSLGMALADPAPVSAPWQDLHKGKTVPIVIHYPPTKPAPVAEYHGQVKPGPTPPPQLPFKVPAFAQRLAKRCDKLKVRYDKWRASYDRLMNPTVRYRKTQATLTADLSAQRQYFTLKVPFDTSQLHWFENLPPSWF